MIKTHVSENKPLRQALRKKSAASSRTAKAFLLLAALSAALLTACGSASSAQSMLVSSETTAAGAASMDMAPEAENMIAETAADIQENGIGGALAETSQGTDSSSSAMPENSDVSSGRKLIRTVELHVEATDFDGLFQNINEAISVMGGYVEQSDISGSSISASPDSRRFASLTVRIPANQLDAFISRVGTAGNVTNKSETTQDVTLQYSDIESKKKTLLVEQDKLWELLAKADSIDAVIALESRLSEIRYQLESMESQLRTYDNQVDYSTVHLYIDEVKVFTPTAPDSAMARIQKGFLRNLQNVEDGIVNFIVWFISSLPSLALLAVIILAAVLVFRRLMKRFPKKKFHLPTIKPTTEKTQKSESTKKS